MGAVIGVDLGGTFVKAGLVRNNRIIKQAKRLTEIKKGRKRVIDNILKTIEEVNKGKIIGIGIGCPGPANYITGKITNTPNLKPLNGINLKKIVQKRFKVKVRMENDANCAALAEKIFRKSKNFVVLTLGTGIGCGVIINNELYRGRGRASEAGHMFIDNGKTLEELASGGALIRKAKQKFGKSLWARDLVSLCKKGNRTAIKIINESAEYLGVGLTNIAAIFDPEIIILTGGLKETGSYYLNIAKKKMDNVALLKCSVVWSKLKEPGITGAASLFKEAL